MKQKQYYNKFSQDFKNGSCQKKILKKNQYTQTKEMGWKRPERGFSFLSCTLRLFEFSKENALLPHPQYSLVFITIWFLKSD